MRIILIAIGLFICVPVVATIGLQLYEAFVVANLAMKVDAAVSNAQDGDVSEPSGKYNITNVANNPSLRAGYEALVNIANPHRQRVIAFNAQVSTRNLLKNGEEKPEADFQDVFASARATAYAAAECDRILKKLASQCSVVKASASKVVKSDGIYNIDAILAFVQKDELGNVEETVPLAYREVRNDLAAGAKRVSVMPDGAERQREKFYDEAARICSRLRKAEGNCAIYRITIKSSPQRGSDALELKGDAQFSFLQKLRS